MVFDLDLIKKVYDEMPSKIAAAKKLTGKALTLSEKILYTHLYSKTIHDYTRGKDYVDFAPDRVAMQDATAQMALLQFSTCGRERVAVPSTVHCDHLIQAKTGAKSDLTTALDVNKEVYDFLSSISNKYGIGFWKPGAGIIHQVVSGKLCFPRWNDDRNGFTYTQCRRTGYDCHWCWRSRCSRCNGRTGLGIENAQTHWH